MRLRQGLLFLRLSFSYCHQLLCKRTVAVTSQYQNIAIENDQCSHFCLVVRGSDGGIVWRAWNFQLDAGEGFNLHIRQGGILKSSSSC
ncbi:DUF905 family protein [Cronobacter dublinensis]|uniref:DUF905 family protein n=1 Tax=Cronobacter dublinensis TaxID=413497 RepID=UPI003ADDB3DB